ncbi:MAG: CDP-alcohol phosphatidyltransferase family protein [Oscillospiraceae bacterium]|nr:CDP-alcohol phosphatidyltransferase family protein [Candidatus Ruminococcus equi]
MANIISVVRIICGLSLVFCPTFSIWFFIVYIIGGVSDVLDGFVARKLHTESEIGAKLDTIADIVFFLVVIIKIICAVDFPFWVLIWIACIAIIKCVNVICGYIVCKSFVSLHTVMNKISGIMLFITPLCIGFLPYKFAMIWVILTCAVATFAAVQEGHFIRTNKGIHN